MTATAQQIHCPANMYRVLYTNSIAVICFSHSQSTYVLTFFRQFFVPVPLPRTSGRENWSTTIIKSYLIPRWVSGFDLSIGALVFLSNKGIGTSLAFIRHSASANKDLLIILHKKTQKVENTSIVLSFNPLWTKEMLSEKVKEYFLLKPQLRPQPQ